MILVTSSGGSLLLPADKRGASGEGGALNSGRIRFEGLRGVWSPFGPGGGLHNDQRQRSVQRSIVDEDNAWPPG